jgi:aspartyl-tRNA(Asn)/glutamyl-tRNA(Gln) amidotransferase subunit C
MSEVTHEDVLRVAQLANLELTADEVPRMARDLSAILGHIAQLSELDTSTVPPMAQVADVLDPAVGLAPNSDGAALRSDEPRPSIDRKAVMAQAPETDGRFFKLPKVIER